MSKLAKRLSARVVSILGANPGPFTLAGTNTYLVGRHKQRVLIDIGEPDNSAYRKALLSTLQKHGARVSCVVCTHHHYDHIGALDGLWNDLGKPVVLMMQDPKATYAPRGSSPEVKDSTHIETLTPEVCGDSNSRTTSNTNGLEDCGWWPVAESVERLPRVSHFPSKTCVPGVPVFRVRDGMELAYCTEEGGWYLNSESSCGQEGSEDELKRDGQGDREHKLDVALRFIATPGHCGDHMSLLLWQEMSVFTGDCILGGSSTSVQDMTQYLASLHKLEDLLQAQSNHKTDGETKSDRNNLYPGHGECMQGKCLEAVRHYIEHRKKRVKQIRSAMQAFANASHTPTAFELVKSVYAKDLKELIDADEKSGASSSQKPDTATRVTRPVHPILVAAGRNVWLVLRHLAQEGIVAPLEPLSASEHTDPVILGMDGKPASAREVETDDHELSGGSDDFSVQSLMFVPWQLRKARL